MNSDSHQNIESLATHWFQSHEIGSIKCGICLPNVHWQLIQMRIEDGICLMHLSERTMGL